MSGGLIIMDQYQFLKEPIISSTTVRINTDLCQCIVTRNSHPINDKQICEVCNKPIY